MKPSAIRIERMLEKIEAAVVPPPRPCLSIITHEGDDQAAAMEKALAEHVACHPEDAGRTVKDFRWIIQEIVQWPRPNPMSADEISAAEISAAAARDEITKGEIEDEPLNGCKGTGGPSETPEPIDLPPPDPGCLARSKPWRPVHQRPARDQRRPTWLKPVVARYQAKVSRIYLRADAAFAMPEVYEFLEAERIIKYAIRLPA